MSIVLILLSLAAAGLGVVLLTQATMGVGFIAGACLLGIYARLAQAYEFRENDRFASERAAGPPPLKQSSVDFRDEKQKRRDRIVGTIIVGGIALAMFISAIVQTTCRTQPTGRNPAYDAPAVP
jgi:hypothetical protein